MDRRVERFLRVVAGVESGMTPSDATIAVPPSNVIGELAQRAERLRRLHRRGDPLVLVNVWDAASASRVGSAGATAIATSSAAVAASLGLPDDNTMEPDLVFAAIRRVAAAVDLPVTADLEAGYELPPTELVQRLLDAGAVGCNLEDSDHRRPGALVDVDVMAALVADVRAAAMAMHVPIVVNARIDVMRHRAGEPSALTDEIVRRGRQYLDAGADCAFPIGIGDPEAARRLVAKIDGCVNTGLDTGVTIAQMAQAGVSRISFGPTWYRRAIADLGDRATEMLRWKR
jgi:2-methylisocitrate lyase-like PEP mutase family enzyme